MWFLFQIAIMTLIIGSKGAYHWGVLPWCCSQLLPPAGCQFGSTTCFNGCAASGARDGQKMRPSVHGGGLKSEDLRRP
jgi:hypothetical protein